ncbi:GEVED domain-containing protein [Brumimicrobium oceani]|uniref:Fibronectin type-III domain-containing protein n=1 Tax=Brumimicrobium oceani TaxID=2100725 RepID=A0A2U2XAJ6_9FLAO|nr:GEVED domain-containing protein [Brumimicrobium oceani]PWH84825.1 hypothetical protein DIT68_12935 [Brumimicrobium oceani]
MKKNILSGLLLFAAAMFGTNVQAQTYCTVSTDYTFDYLSAVSSNLAVSNVSYSASTQPAGSYADETTQTFESFETQTFEINTSYVGGGNGVNIWVDWNNDFTFDPAELMASLADGNANKTLMVTVPVGTPVGDYRMRVRGQYGSTANPPACGQVLYGSTIDFKLSIVAPPTCLPPTGLTASNISATSADLSWTENNGATTWEVEYGVAGFTPGSGTLSGPITTNPYTVAISANTAYEFYVQTDCGGGDFSTWAGPYYFDNTYCTPSYSSTSEYLSLVETNGAIVDASFTATAQPTGGYSDETAQVIEAYETMLFDLTTTYTPSFGNSVAVWVDWNQDFNFDASELLSLGQNSNATIVQQLTIPAGTPQGNYRMRVRGIYGSFSTPVPCGSATWGTAVDFTLNIIAPPSCLPVMDIDTVNVSTTSVELTWTELNSATSWEIEYGPAGFTPGSGTFATATSNPFVITGLNPSSEYDFYVQSDCGGGDSSAWRGPYSVYTDCGIALAPYSETFSSGIQPQCWDNLSSAPGSANTFWKFTGAPGYGATANGRAAGTYAWTDGSTPTPDSIMLVTPPIDLGALTTPYLAFEWFSNNTTNPGDNNPMIVEVYDGSTWTYLDTLAGDSTEWMFVNYDLSAFMNDTIQVRFMVNQTTTTSSAFYNDVLLDNVVIDDCISLGGQDGSLDVCRLDNTVNLEDNIIVKPNGGGNWSFPDQSAYLVDDTIFNVQYLPVGTYEVFYVERAVCYDTTLAIINVFGPSSAGTDGTVTVCKNAPIDLFSALSGSVDMGGDWYDFSNTLLNTAQPKAQNIPGQYNFNYVVTNGVCPADTALVEVSVLGDCDWLSIGEEMFAEISVFPNPATSFLTISNPANTSSLKVEMLDMNGRVVLVENKELNNASESTLSIDHLEKGIYTMRIYNNEGQKTFKIVKQ